MRILYGVQATGQGHISRARAMARALAEYEVEVDWLFSGRPRGGLFDMEPFTGFSHRRGLTFATRNGGISYMETAIGNNLISFAREVASLRLVRYDLIVTDFEPVSAWAGKLSGTPTIGIGHQYAFGGASPVAGGNWLSRFIMRHFAPVNNPLGLHWHPYSDNILPPILDLPARPPGEGEHYLVYLPFENQDAVTAWLQQFPGIGFRQYAPGLSAETRANVFRHPPSIGRFKQDLASSRGVICNSGFELISECLQWQRPVLTKPLQGQMEQLSNALALSQLGYARVIDRLDSAVLADWLRSPNQAPLLRFSDVAATLARWLANGCPERPAQLHQALWSASGIPGYNTDPGRARLDHSLPVPIAGHATSTSM